MFGIGKTEYVSRHAKQEQETAPPKKEAVAGKVTRRVGVPLVVIAAVLFGSGSIAFAKPVKVVAGDTFSALVRTHCKTNNWQGTALPGRNKNLIFAGETLNINCPGASAKAAPKPAKATPKKAKPVVKKPAAPVYKGWVNPLPGAALTSCYGPRWGTIHQGIDMAGSYGAHIRAASAGVVKQVGWIGGGYGREVMIYHGHGVWTHYAHTSAVVVRVGQRVVAGQYIAREGATGDVTGPHLHFEVETDNYGKTFIYGNQQNPAPVLRAHGVKIGC